MGETALAALAVFTALFSWLKVRDGRKVKRIRSDVDKFRGEVNDWENKVKLLKIEVGRNESLIEELKGKVKAEQLQRERMEAECHHDKEQLQDRAAALERQNHTMLGEIRELQAKLIPLLEREKH